MSFSQLHCVLGENVQSVAATVYLCPRYFVRSGLTGDLRGEGSSILLPQLDFVSTPATVSLFILFFDHSVMTYECCPIDRFFSSFFENFLLKEIHYLLDVCFRGLNLHAFTDTLIRCLHGLWHVLKQTGGDFWDNCSIYWFCKRTLSLRYHRVDNNRNNNIW